VRTLATIVLALALAAPAAGQYGNNPDCQVCIDFSGTASDWTGVQSRIDPEPNTVFSAYFTIYSINELAGICFRVSVTEDMSAVTSFTNLLPGDLAIGSWDTGITIASTECMTDDLVYIGRLDMFYTGTPGDVMILDHPQWPRWVIDCTYPPVDDPLMTNFYCVWMHGGVGKDPEDGDPGCDPPGWSPVEDATWGEIKALFK
jgi:hypothetical protein